MQGWKVHFQWFVASQLGTHTICHSKHNSISIILSIIFNNCRMHMCIRHVYLHWPYIDNACKSVSVYRKAKTRSAGRVHANNDDLYTVYRECGLFWWAEILTCNQTLNVFDTCPPSMCKGRDLITVFFLPLQVNGTCSLTYIGHHLFHKNGQDDCPLDGQSKKLHAHELLNTNQGCSCHESQIIDKDYFSDFSQGAWLLL